MTDGPYIGETYTEDYKAKYAVRDESYEGIRGDIIPRFHLHRIVPSGGMATGVTSYTDKETADLAANVLNALVLKEVP